MLGRSRTGARDPLALTLGVLLIALAVLAVQAALGLVFDPRYRDFPFAPLTAAVVPFLLLRCSMPRRPARARCAETVAAAVLVLCAVYIVWNERSPTGRRCGSARRWSASRSACFGRGPRQAEDQERRRRARDSATL